MVLKDPAPSVGVSSLGESSIALAVEPWVAVTNYGAVQGGVEQVDSRTMPDAWHRVAVLSSRGPFGEQLTTSGYHAGTLFRGRPNRRDTFSLVDGAAQC